MNKFKILIMMISIVIIFIIIFLISINIIGDKEEEEGFEEQSTLILDEIQEEETPKFKEVIDKNTFFSINTCLQNYYTYIQETNEEVFRDKTKEDIIYDMTDKTYLKENNITKENILNNMMTINYTSTYVAKEMNELSIGDNVKAYYVKGRIVDYAKQDAAKNVYDIVIIDKTNMTYAIVPNQENSLEELENILKKYENKNINKTDENLFKFAQTTAESIAKIYFSDYKRNALYDIETAYDSIDKEYKNKRFQTIEKYQEYINKNSERLKKMSMDKYKIEKKDGYTEYVYINTYGDYCIIRETSVMKYSVLLDTYTVNIPEFTEKYDKADNMTKVALNIEKIISALNSKDYEYVYNKLDSGFKANNFSTLEAFEEAVTFSFYENNTVEYVEYDTQGDIHIYTILLKPVNDEENHEVTKQIFMRLKEGYDYTFSYSLN